MSIITLSEALDFCDIFAPEVGPGNVVVDNGTYTFAQLETAMAAALNSFSEPTPTGTIYLSGTYDVDSEEYTIDDTSDDVLMFGYTLDEDEGYTITFEHTEGVQTFPEDDLDPDDVVQNILDAADKWVKNYCRRDFESASYSEHRNGNGKNYLFLNHYPVTDVTRLAIGRRDAIWVRNTSSTTTASASVTSTGLVLTKDGTADSTCLFATYTTLTTLVAAVNALSGWEAGLCNTDFASYLSTELLERYGLRCIDSHYVYLEMPDLAEDQFDINTDTGELNLDSGTFSVGFKNIFVEYTAGYSSAAMPEDLKTAVKIIVKDWYDKRNESAFNLSAYSVGGLSKAIIDSVPREARMILDSYRRMRVV